MSNGSGWIQAIHELLREGLVANEAELREDDPGSTCGTVRIHRSGKCVFISTNAMVEGVSIKDRLFPLFRQQPGITRMCDYWILYEHRERGASTPVLYVFLCELKSGTASGLAQIENGKLLADYFLGMVAHHRQLALGNVQYRGIVFSPAYRAPKASIKPGKAPPYVEQGPLRIPVLRLGAPSRGDAPKDYTLPSLCG